jgi:hypothetical protein
MRMRRVTAGLAVFLLGACAWGVAAASEAPPPAAGHEVEFARRRSALRAGDHEAALALARWALERDLPDRAEDLYRAILRAEPDHDEAYPAIWALGSAERPHRSEAFEKARSLTTGAFEEHQTPHYVILSDADPEWVRGQGELLERTYERFMSFSNAFDLRALPLRHKLVAIIFRNVDDFRAFARATAGAGGAADDIRGFYDVAQDRLVLYRVERRDDVAEARAQLDEMASEVEALRRELRRLRGTARREETARTQEEFDRKSALYERRLEELSSFIDQDDMAVVIHEAGHQLMFHTRVQAPEVQQPLWLSEGLAMTFEDHDAGGTQGGLRPHVHLRRHFRQVLARGEHLPLRELVSLVAMPEEPRRWQTLYAQSCVLLRWLGEHRRFELHTYIRRINARRGGAEGSAAELVAAFEEAFGDLAALERAWLEAEAP